MTIPEILKEVVEDAGGLETVAEPLFEVVAGLGALGAVDLSEVFGPEIAGAIGELAGSAKKLWDLAGGSDIIEQVTRAITPGTTEPGATEPGATEPGATEPEI
ncbi:MAG: hypothetical protein QOF30_3299 [Acidimicrobiaceae bacterium]|nr:hypothetical protein [Acidimicrobiaceae bacterium]